MFLGRPQDRTNTETEMVYDRPFGSAHFQTDIAAMTDSDWIATQVNDMNKTAETVVLSVIGHLGVPPAHQNRELTQVVLRAVLEVLAKPPHELIGP